MIYHLCRTHWLVSLEYQISTKYSSLKLRLPGWLWFHPCCAMRLIWAMDKLCSTSRSVGELKKQFHWRQLTSFIFFFLCNSEILCSSLKSAKAEDVRREVQPPVLSWTVFRLSSNSPIKRVQQIISNFHENFLVVSYWLITMKVNLRTINITWIKWYPFQIHINKLPNTYKIHYNSQHSKSQLGTNKKGLISPRLSNILDNFPFIRKLS